MRTVVLTLLALLLIGFDAQAVVSKGNQVPDFPVEGEGGRVVRLSEHVGRYVLIIYEDRASAGQNVALKQRLWDLHRRGRLDERMVVMPIADVRAFKEWPASQYARKAVDAERARTGRVLFADFTGEAGVALDAVPGRSTLVFLDPEGQVLWSGEGPQGKPDQARLIRLVQAKAGVADSERSRKAKVRPMGNVPDAPPAP